MSQARRLMYLLLLNLVMIAGLVLVGSFSHSLSVLAAGGDFVADSFAIALGIFAVYMRDKHGKSRAPGYVALINGLLLLGVTVLVCVEAVSRLIGGSPEVHGLPVLIVAVVSTVAMAAGVLVLGRGAGNEDLHMRSVLLDTASDGLSAAGVAVVGGIMYVAHGLYWLDAAAAIAISVVIAYGAVRLLRDVCLSLRHGNDLELGDD
jgi:cobalt-zinc-cadmium efflux system protein